MIKKIALWTVLSAVLILASGCSLGNLDKNVINQTAGLQERLLSTVSDVYQNHYHNQEFIDGTLYVIRRISDDGVNGVDLQDELWKITENSQQKIYSSKAIDFRVSPDQKFVMVTDNGNIVILNNSYKEIDRVTMSEFANQPTSAQFFDFSWSQDGKYFDYSIINTDNPVDLYLNKDYLDSLVF